MDAFQVLSLLSQAAALNNQAANGRTHTIKLRDQMLRRALDEIPSSKLTDSNTLASFIKCGAAWAVRDYIGSKTPSAESGRSPGLYQASLQALRASRFDVLSVVNDTGHLSPAMRRLLISSDEEMTSDQISWLDAASNPVFEDEPRLLHVIQNATEATADTLVHILTDHAHAGHIGPHHIKLAATETYVKSLVAFVLLPIPDSAFASVSRSGITNSDVLKILDLRASSHGRLRLHEREPDLTDVLARPCGATFFGLAA